MVSLFLRLVKTPILSSSISTKLRGEQDRVSRRFPGMRGKELTRGCLALVIHNYLCLNEFLFNDINLLVVSASITVKRNVVCVWRYVHVRVTMSMGLFRFMILLFEYLKLAVKLS